VALAILPAKTGGPKGRPFCFCACAKMCPMSEFAIRFDQRALDEFCRRWRIAELSLFGSALGDRFREDSDVDLLVTFEPGTARTFSDWMDMVLALEALFGRKVDLVEERFLTNPFRRKSILSSRKIIYAA
jgi:hypothetical protein